MLGLSFRASPPELATSRLQSLSACSLLVFVLALVGCASSEHQAPVEDRGVATRPVAVANTASAAPTTTEAAKPLPGAENAGKSGYYTIKPGDTLIRVGLDQGQNWKDIAKWNNIDNPNLIEVGQVLRVAPPGAEAAPMGARPVTTAKVESKPLDTKPAAPSATTAPAAVTPTPAPASTPAASSATSTAASPSPPATAGVPGGKDADDDVNWQWPATGSVVSQFDEGKTKGLAIAGRAGDPVLAAADGKAVYVGSAIRGYGNLIVIQHNGRYLTAYAHNQALLVKEGQTVRRGQRIAEMGSTDADRVQLHFEIRRHGKPIDPAKLLPTR
ncbi:MAG: peptidoglycan DD-metalloendopeptidase family protein [Rhizobacter sp.]